jgi:hypothetical protein
MLQQITMSEECMQPDRLEVRMDKDLKNERNTDVNRKDSNWDSGQGSSEDELEPSRRPSEAFEGSTGNISGGTIDEDSEIESEDGKTKYGGFAEGSRSSRSHLEN